MSPRLRLFVLCASTVLTLLALPDCCLVIGEELAQPLTGRGTPLVARSAEPSLPDQELLAMRALDGALAQPAPEPENGARTER